MIDFCIFQCIGVGEFDCDIDLAVLGSEVKKVSKGTSLPFRTCPAFLSIEVFRWEYPILLTFSSKKALTSLGEFSAREVPEEVCRVELKPDVGIDAVRTEEIGHAECDYAIALQPFEGVLDVKGVTEGCGCVAGLVQILDELRNSAAVQNCFLDRQPTRFQRRLSGRIGVRQKASCWPDPCEKTSK